MSYVQSQIPPILSWGGVTAEMCSILGSYKKGTFKHENLDNDDFEILNEAKGLVGDILKEIEMAESKIYDFNKFPELKKPLIDFGIIISIHPSAKNPSELKEQIMNYNEIIHNVLEKKPLNNIKLEKTYNFFKTLSDMADYEAAKYHSLPDDD